MRTIVDLLVTAMLLMGSGYAAKGLFLSLEKAAVKKIDQGLSSSEQFAEKLTSETLPF